MRRSDYTKRHREGGREPFAFAGFSERDQYAENISFYAEKLASLVDPLRRTR